MDALEKGHSEALSNSSVITNLKRKKLWKTKTLKSFNCYCKQNGESLFRNDVFKKNNL